MSPATTISLTAADIGPGTHVLYRKVVSPGAHASDVASLRNTLEEAARLARHGGLICDLGHRATCIEGAVYVSALVTVAQLVAVLYEEGHNEVATGRPPAALLAGTDEAAMPVATLGLEAWVRATDEDVRARGVPRLAQVLAASGVTGNVERAADHLWTTCGY